MLSGADQYFWQPLVPGDALLFTRAATTTGAAQLSLASAPPASLPPLGFSVEGRNGE